MVWTSLDPRGLDVYSTTIFRSARNIRYTLSKISCLIKTRPGWVLGQWLGHGLKCPRPILECLGLMLASGFLSMHTVRGSSDASSNWVPPPTWKTRIVSCLPVLTLTRLSLCGRLGSQPVDRSSVSQNKTKTNTNTRTD